MGYIYFQRPDCTHGSCWSCLRKTHWLVVSPTQQSPKALSRAVIDSVFWSPLTSHHAGELDSSLSSVPFLRKAWLAAWQKIALKEWPLNSQYYSVLPRLRDFHWSRWNNLTIQKITSQMPQMDFFILSDQHMASLKLWMDFSWESSVAAGGRNEKQQ